MFTAVAAASLRGPQRVALLRMLAIDCGFDFSGSFRFSWLAPGPPSRSVFRMNSLLVLVEFGIVTLFGLYPFAVPAAITFLLLVAILFSGIAASGVMPPDPSPFPCAPAPTCFFSRPGRATAQAEGVIEDLKKVSTTRLDAIASQKARSTATRLEIWFADEAPIGQKNKVTIGGRSAVSALARAAISV